MSDKALFLKLMQSRWTAFTEKKPVALVSDLEPGNKT